MPFKSKKINYLFVTYWFLLAYIIAALIWWYIALTQQNAQMIALKTLDLKKDDPGFAVKYENIQKEKKRKTAQYLGEGSIFLLLISAGAIFVYRAANRQLKISRQQQNFMIAVTHELKTPLAITKLNLETMQKRKLDDVQQQRLLHNTLQEASRMNALCNNMLLSSQIDAGGYRMVEDELNIAALLQKSIEDFSSRFPQRHIEGEMTDEAFINADPLLIQMAINNLLDNAIKYSPKEGKIFISLKQINHEIELRISDEGQGIAEAERKKVFEKFHRLGNEATRHAKGTGIGLYLVRQVVLAHKGKIFIESNYPNGSVFIIQLAQA